jgi:hypothetical protein
MKVDTSEFLTVAVFGLATLLIARAGWRHRHNGRASDSLPWTWLALRAYSESTDPRHNPRRHPSGEAIYSRYKAWIQERGLDNHGYIVRYAKWSASGLALEPNLVPYHLEAGVSHWVLWHHPDLDAPGDKTLDPSEERLLVARLLGDEESSGPTLRPSEVIVYQNAPANRSIPTIAHSHVFFFPAGDAPGLRLSAQLAARRAAWRARSPWLNREAGEKDERERPDRVT